MRAACAEARRPQQILHTVGDGGDAGLQRLDCIEPRAESIVLDAAAKAPGDDVQQQVGVQLAHLAQQRPCVLVQLAGQPRAQMGGLVVEDRRDLVLDDRVLLLDDEHLVAGLGERAQPFRLKRPHHAHLVDGDAEGAAAVLVEPQAAQRLDHVQVRLPGADHAQPVAPRAAPGQPVQLVGAHPGLGGGVALFEVPRLDLQRRAVTGAQPQSARRQLEILRRGVDGAVHVGRDGGAALHCVGQRLHADPAAAVPAHRPGGQAVGDQLLHRGRVEHRHAEMDQSEVALMRQRGGARAVVVAAQRDGAAQRRHAGVARVLEHVRRAVHPGTLAVPQAEHALLLCTRQQPDLLRAPHGGGGEVLVDAGLEDDVVRVEVLAGRPQCEVVAAERAAAVAGDEAGGVVAGGTVAPSLQQRQAHQGLYAG